MAHKCEKLVIDADGNMKLVKVDYWEFTGYVRCSHCDHVFHDGTLNFAAKTASAAWEIVRSLAMR